MTGIRHLADQSHATLDVFQVQDLSQALNSIQSLPSLNEAKAEVVTHQKDLEEMKAYYTDQNNALREQLQEVQRDKHSTEEELTAQVEGEWDFAKKRKNLFFFS